MKDVEVPVLERVNDVQDHIGASNHVENLTASAFSFGGALNQPGQVKNLDFGSSVFHDTWDTCQGGKGVASRFGVSVGHLGDEGGLSHRGETDQRNGRITGFSDFKPFTPPLAFEWAAVFSS